MLKNKMTIIIPKHVYLTIVAASVRFANRKIPQDDWLEVSGIFIGKNDGDDVIIEEAYPIMHQELDKNAVIDQYKWKDEDYEALSLIDDEAFSKGLFCIGWWHSHPGFKVMMSHIDIKTTLSYQINNSLGISLVFNPMRLVKQIELPDTKGNPEIQLKNDPGFKIFRLDDVNQGIEASYHTVDYQIEDYDNMEQLVKLTQKFIIDITNFFPKDDIFETYEKFIMEKIQTLNSLLLGTEEYLATLIRKGESHRVSEVLNNQIGEISKYVAQTSIKIENIKQFMNYLEYKERKLIIPQVHEILSKWDESISTLDARLNQLAKKYK